MSLPNKIIFLDIDGVMNSLQSMKEIGHSFPFKDQANFSPEALSVVKKLIEDGCHIVISSTWRTCVPSSKLCFFLDVCDSSVIGITDEGDKTKKKDGEGKFPECIRGVEIKNWLENARAMNLIDESSSFVIIDDDSDMLEEQLPNFVKTDFMTRGLTWDHYQKICDVLGIPLPELIGE